MRIFLIVALLLASQLAEAGQEPPFPQLDTQGYCTALVSKMLVKAEQQAEKDKCLTDETALKAKLEPFWYLVTPEENQRLMRDYMKEVRFHTYLTVGDLVDSALGRACLDGRVFCSIGEPTADTLFSALKSDPYCNAKFPDEKANERRDCLEGEEKRKAILAGYWAALRPDWRSYCLQFFSQSGKFTPFQVLSGCVARDIGDQCLKQKRQCRPG
ncbi:hypothetical protein [Mesorhizobium sp. B2-7-1]|uniref:hypothetical protein n=1 Tax=Mesorhizobium sp. B2-7-1 TaxID=2589909 RepID=UPI00112AE5A1|nr:hypothetical protein [Mesorhizobium sp. B2-7-1]TPJ62163.1 hypothetical protein FJ471_16835 [Mesorhizobium sp. B2-7-1]